jgi:hypothetical protein
MNNRQDRVCRAASKAVTCARDLKPRHSRVSAAADRLEASVEAARAASAKQLVARKARGQPRHSVKRAKAVLFHVHLVPIATDGLELLAGMPGIEEELNLPRLKAPAEEHLRAAKRVRRVAMEHNALFVESRDYDATFLERFDEAVRDLGQAESAGTGAGRAAYTAATREVQEAVEEVQRCFDSLNARMNEVCFGDREALAEWRRQSRIPGKIGRPKKRKSKGKSGDEADGDEAPPEANGAD